MRLDPGITRDGARELAHQELLDPRYASAQPSPAARLVRRIGQALADLLDTAGAHTPGGQAGVIVVLLALVLLTGLLAVRLRVTGGAGAGGAVFTTGASLTAAEHRSRAEALAADGAFDEAVRERLRAVVRELEARGVLDPRPGRTADEVATEVGRLVPALLVPMRRAATTFDEVWYGGRHADRAAYDVLVDVDATVTATRMVLT